MESLRICFLSYMGPFPTNTAYEGYGGEAIMARCVEELSKRGHEVTLIASPGSMTPVNGKLIVKSSYVAKYVCPLCNLEIGNMFGSKLDVCPKCNVKATLSGNLSGQVELSNVLSEGVKDALLKADVVHDSSNFKIAAKWAFENRKDTHVIQHLIGNDVWNVRLPKNVVAISQNHRQHIIHNSFGYQQLPFPPQASNVRGIHVKDARVVYPDIDLDYWKPSEGKGDDKGIYNCWYSRCHPDKGLDDVIDIAGISKRRFKMFGAHSIGDHHSYFYDKRSDHPRPYVDMIREVPNIEWLEEEAIAGNKRVELVSKASAFVFPVGLRTNYAEAFGLVLLEALACGTPILVSPYGSAPEIVTHGKTGFVCPDVTTFAERLDDVKLLKPEACRNEAVTKYYKGRQAEEFEKIYADLLNGVTW